MGLEVPKHKQAYNVIDYYITKYVCVIWDGQPVCVQCVCFVYLLTLVSII